MVSHELVLSHDVHAAFPLAPPVEAPDRVGPGVKEIPGTRVKPARVPETVEAPYINPNPPDMHPPDRVGDGHGDN